MKSLGGCSSFAPVLSSWLLAEWRITVEPYFSGEGDYLRLRQYARSRRKNRTVQIPD
jgi:hypothetical protein